MGASMGKNCDTLTYDEYKTACSEEVANLAKGKCPSITVTKEKCKNVCISNDENSCKGYSVKSSSGGKYVDSQGNCVNIPPGNCPILKYRSSSGGSCKSLPALKTCIQAFNNNELTYNKGYTLDPLFNSVSCPNNICDTTICKPKAMTCKEKTETYSTLKCPGNSLLKDNARVETTKRNTLQKQFKVGGSDRCCSVPPACLQYIYNNSNVSCSEGKFFDPYVNCSSFKTQSECTKHACVFTNNKCSSATKIDGTNFSDRCCSKATCSKLNQGYCRKTSRGGNMLSKQDCPTITGNNLWEERTCGNTGKIYDSGKGSLQPENNDFTSNCCSFKTCHQQNLDRNNQINNARANILILNIASQSSGDGTAATKKKAKSDELCSVNTTEIKCNQMNDGINDEMNTNRICHWVSGKCEGCDDSVSNKNCPDLSNLKPKLCSGMKDFETLSRMDKPSEQNATNDYLPKKCKGIITGDNATCEKIKTRSSCINEKDDIGAKIDDAFGIMAGQPGYNAIGLDLSTNNIAKLAPYICKWEYNDGDKRKYVTINNKYDRNGNLLDGMPRDVDPQPNPKSGCCREAYCDKLDVSTDSYIVDNYNKLGFKLVDSSGIVTADSGQKLCPDNYIVNEMGRHTKKPHAINVNSIGTNESDQRTSCIGKDSSGNEIEEKNITKEACTLSNKANVFGSNTNSITNVEFKETCCKPITCQIYKDAVVGKKYIGTGNATVTTTDLTCGSLQTFNPGNVIDSGSLYTDLQSAYNTQDGNLNKEKNTFISEFKRACCSPIKCKTIKKSTSPKYTCKPENSKEYIFDPTKSEVEFTGSFDDEFIEGFQGGKLVEGVTATNKKCCKLFEPTCLDVLNDNQTIHQACGPGKVPDIYDCTKNNVCTKKTLTTFSTGDKMISTLDTAKQTDFRNICCKGSLTNNNYCQGISGVKSINDCWSVCKSDNKAKTHTERIKPPDYTVVTRQEKDDGSDGSLCRPAFGHKKFETNYKELNNASNECKLKITREIGKCVHSSSTDSETEECIKEVVDNRVCSVSKNGGGVITAGNTGWSGAENQDKSYIEEPGSCSSYAWDVGLNNDIYKETKLYTDIKSDHLQGDEEALTDIRMYNRVGRSQGAASPTNTGGSRWGGDVKDLWPKYGVQMYREQLPISYQVDSSILESIRKKDQVQPANGLPPAVYKINKAAKYHIPVTNEDLYAEIGNTTLPGDQTLKSADKQEDLTKGSVPKTFPASLRAWQGYKNISETGNYTVSVEDRTNKTNTDYTVQMPSKSGYDENTKNTAQKDTHIPFGGVGYGAQFLDTRCFVSDNKMNKNPKCKETKFSFAQGNTDEEKLTSQCPVDMYYDVNKGDKTLSTDGSFIETVKEFSKECCSKELQICEKMNLSGLSESVSNYNLEDDDSEVNDGTINVNSSDIFELWKINKTDLIKSNGKPLDKIVSRYYSQNPLFMEKEGGACSGSPCPSGDIKDYWRNVHRPRSGDPENSRICNAQTDVCLTPAEWPQSNSDTPDSQAYRYNLRWWKHIDGLHGYGVSVQESHSDLSGKGEVSVINSNPGGGVHRVHGHTIGCWTKCDANYVNNKLKTVATTSCSSNPSIGIYKEPNLTAALQRCETLFKQDIPQTKINQIKNMSSESKKKLEIEKELAKLDQCAVFQFPVNPGYEFSLDKNKQVVMPSDYTKPENIKEEWKFRQRYNDETGLNKLKLAKIKPDIFKSLCPGEWIVIRQNSGNSLDITNMNNTSGSDIKNEDPTETPPPTPYHKTYDETYGKETFEDEISKLMEDNNLSEAEFDTQLTDIVKAYFIYLSVSGYEDSNGDSSKEINNNKIITFLSGKGVKFKGTGSTPTTPKTFIKNVDVDVGVNLVNSGGDNTVYTAFENKIDTDNLYNLYAKGGEHVIDLRAGPNSANTINGKQVSLVYNNRCALTNLVNGGQLSQKVSTNNDGSRMFDDLNGLPITKPATIRTTESGLQSASTRSRLPLITKQTLDDDVDFFNHDDRVNAQNIVSGAKYTGTGNTKITVNQNQVYHTDFHNLRDNYLFPHYADIPTAFEGDRYSANPTPAWRDLKYNKKPTTTPSDPHLSRCNQIKYRHGIITRRGIPDTITDWSTINNMSHFYAPTIFGTYNWGATQLEHRAINHGQQNWNIHYMTTKRLEPNDFSGTGSSDYYKPYDEMIRCAKGDEERKMEAALTPRIDNKLSAYWGETPAEKKERHRRICSHMKLFENSYKSIPENADAIQKYNTTMNTLGCDNTTGDLKLLNYGDITQCQQFVDTYGVIDGFKGNLLREDHKRGNPNHWHVKTKNHERGVYGSPGENTPATEKASYIWDNMCFPTNARSNYHGNQSTDTAFNDWKAGKYNEKDGTPIPTDYNLPVPRKGKKLPGETDTQMENREFNICANINYAAGLRSQDILTGCDCSNLKNQGCTDPCKKVWDALDCGESNRFTIDNTKKTTNSAYGVSSLSGTGQEHRYSIHTGSKYYLGPMLREHPVHDRLNSKDQYYMGSDGVTDVSVYVVGSQTTSTSNGINFPNNVSIVGGGSASDHNKPYGEPFFTSATT